VCPLDEEADAEVEADEKLIRALLPSILLFPSPLSPLLSSFVARALLVAPLVRLQ